MQGWLKFFFVETTILPSKRPSYMQAVKKIIVYFVGFNCLLRKMTADLLSLVWSTISEQNAEQPIQEIGGLRQQIQEVGRVQPRFSVHKENEVRKRYI